MICVKKFTRISAILVFTLAVLLGAAGFAIPVNADAVTVDSDRALNEALGNSAVNEINVTYSPALIMGNAAVARPLKITGNGGELKNVGGRINVTGEGSLELGNITISSDNDYMIRSEGRVIFGDGVTVGGTYGVELTAGGSVTSGGKKVSVEESVKHAVAVTSGEASVSDIDMTGGGTLVYVSQIANALSLSGNIRLISDAGNAIYCATGGGAASVTVVDNSVLTLSSPNALTQEGYFAAALDNYSGKLTVGSGAKITATGTTTAIRAADVVLGDNSTATVTCMRNSGIGSESAGITGINSVLIGSGAKITAGSDGNAKGNGVYGGKVEFTSGSGLVSYGSGSDAYSLGSGSTVNFGAGCAFQSKNTPIGITCAKGLTFGEGCNIEISGAKQYGIKATGTLIADKIAFGEKCIVTISSDYCAVYTNEALEIGHGCECSFTGGSKAPALWIDTALDSQGHLLISGAKVNIKSSVNASSVLNSAVYTVGAITVENGAEVTTVCDGDFGMISRNGDINIGSSAKLCASGSCGLYLKEGNLRISDGGVLYAEGLLDSAVRIEKGMLRVGEGASIDAQGARFGAEILVSGGVWIDGAKLFDFRSMADRAIFIENGSFNVNNIARVSAWIKKPGGGNKDKWWTKDTTGMRSWEITTALSVDEQLTADETKLNPVGSQSFKGGAGEPASDLTWTDTTAFELADYCRIAISKSRPIARSNSFNIQSGKTFSWWLYGESYYGAVEGFKAAGSNGVGEFELKPNGKFTYSAPASAKGIQTFSFVTYDRDGLESELATVSILVTASKPPTAASATFETSMNRLLEGNLEVKDYDGSIAQVTVVDKPQHGSLTVGSDGTFVYKPNDFYCGIDTFTYFATDNKGDESPVAYVSVLIGMEFEAVAYNDTFVTDRDNPVSGKLKARATVNKYAEKEEDKPFLTDFQISKLPGFGTLVFDSMDSVTYTPYEDFAGVDSFSYVAISSDGAVTNEATVALVIIPNQKPSASSFSVSCLKNYRYSGSFVAEDLDGAIESWAVSTQPQHGRVTVGKEGEFTYVPSGGFTGRDTFTYTVTDDEGFMSKEATVIVEVRPLVKHLSAIGRLGLMLLILIGIIALIITAVILAIKHAKKQKKQKELEEAELEKARIRQMIEFGDLNGLPQTMLDRYRR